MPPKSRTAMGTGPDSTIRSIGVEGALTAVEVPVDSAAELAVDVAVDVAADVAVDSGGDVGMFGSGAMGMVILPDEGMGQ
ncbi:hypothetical protein GCM10023317_00990 [Actinopolymorpha pittospori]